MIKKLQWDSGFFGFPVGVAYLNEKPRWEEFVQVFKHKMSGYRLIYLITGEKVIVPEWVLKKFHGRSINQKVLFSKNISGEECDIPEYITEYHETHVNDDLIDLAHLSGYYSRFKIDSNFVAGKFKELYATWIKRSLDRSIADKIFVARHNGRIAAMLSCKYDNATCNIGLVAVHESEQGKGTGRYLMQLAENHAYNGGLTSIHVPTQSNNIIACRFYEKLGYSPINITNYYHFWV
jgi:dTDP-4-amino-4,6-dideoxy-D-galactose acyltransferase